MAYETKKTITEKVLKYYSYGSRVYGCHTESSDYDFIVVVESDEDLYYSVEQGNMNMTVYSESMFIKRIKEHHISVLECIFQSEHDPYLKHFELDKSILRQSISSVAGNSFGKCGKKLKQGDIYIGKKSLFHSLRIIGFGTQIALTGRIVNYSAYNHYLFTLKDLTSTDWEVYKKIFKPEFNRMKSNFKKVAPLKG